MDHVYVERVAEPEVYRLFSTYCKDSITVTAASMLEIVAWALLHEVELNYEAAEESQADQEDNPR